MYKSESEDDPYAIPTIIQHGDISEISWVLESGDVGGIILVWIGVIFIISVSLASFYVSQQKKEASEAAKASDKKKKKRK